MNVTSYSGLQSGPDFENTSADIGKLKSQDIGEGGVKIRENIVIWVQKKAGAPIITINTFDEAQSFLKKYHSFVVGLFNKFEGYEYNEFVKATKSDDEIQFLETSNSDAAKLLFPDLKTNNVFIGMVKTEAERYTAYDGSYKVDKILEFLGSNKFPLITKLAESNTLWVYSSPVKLHVISFCDFSFVSGTSFKSLFVCLQL